MFRIESGVKLTWTPSRMWRVIFVGKSGKLKSKLQTRAMKRFNRLESIKIHLTVSITHFIELSVVIFARKTTKTFVKLIKSQHYISFLSKTITRVFFSTWELSTTWVLTKLKQTFLTFRIHWAINYIDFFAATRLLLPVRYFSGFNLSGNIACQWKGKKFNARIFFHWKLRHYSISWTIYFDSVSLIYVVKENYTSRHQHAKVDLLFS